MSKPSPASFRTSFAQAEPRSLPRFLSVCGRVQEQALVPSNWRFKPDFNVVALEIFVSCVDYDIPFHARNHGRHDQNRATPLAVPVRGECLGPMRNWGAPNPAACLRSPPRSSRRPVSWPRRNADTEEARHCSKRAFQQGRRVVFRHIDDLVANPVPPPRHPFRAFGAPDGKLAFAVPNAEGPGRSRQDSGPRHQTATLASTRRIRFSTASEPAEQDLAKSNGVVPCNNG